jgi:hypothetical protein
MQNIEPLLAIYHLVSLSLYRDNVTRFFISDIFMKQLLLVPMSRRFLERFSIFFSQIFTELFDNISDSLLSLSLVSDALTVLECFPGVNDTAY